MWRYIGPLPIDPHRHVYFPGWPHPTRHDADRTPELLDPLLAADAEPGVAELHHLVDHNAQHCQALIYRHDGAVCGFVRTIDSEPQGYEQLVEEIRTAFPQLFDGHKVPFAAFRDADLPPAPPPEPETTADTPAADPQPDAEQPSPRSRRK